jgi:hypothetical protein
MFLMLIGFAVGAWLLPGPRTIGTITFDVHTLLYAAATILLGFQAIAFAIFTKLFAVSEGLHPPDSSVDKLFRYVNLEKGLLIGAALAATGLLTSIYAVKVWETRHFGPLDFSYTLRIVIPAVLCLTLGIQSIFCSFFLSVLGMRRR